jgi:hypothetical protein
MSTQSHNFYGFQKVNNFGEVDPRVFCRLSTGGGNVIATGSTARIVFTVVETDPYHMAFQDGGGLVGARVPTSGRWRIRCHLYCSQGVSTISVLDVYKTPVPVYSAGGVMQTTNATSLAYSPQSSSGGQSAMIVSITPELTKGDIIFLTVASSGASTNLPTSSDTAFFELELISPDA